MKSILSYDETVVKVFNNNIVLVDSFGKEKILFAKGIGFAKKPGAIIPKNTEIDKIFTIENVDNISNLKDIIKKIDDGFFAACEEAIYEISKELDTELNERIHIGLIDHLFIAVERLKKGDEIENPFLIETKTLYPKEFKLAELVCRMIEIYSEVVIPTGEIGFVALHIHSAMNDGKISNTIKNTYLSSEIVEHVEEKLGIKIDKTSLDYARFCTHIKFAIQRIMEDRPESNELVQMVKITYKKSYEIATEVAQIIEEELNKKVTKEEIAFLTIHIERFRVSAQ